MILTKGKHNFWSQLLLSMIAIFALPQVQSVEKSTPISNAQALTQQIQQFNQLVVRVKKPLHQLQLSAKSRLSSAKRKEIRPHFFSRTIKNSAPIRAGPTFLD